MSEFSRLKIIIDMPLVGINAQSLRSRVHAV